MIIIGYQGIGKSTASRSSYKYIDFESNCFWVNGTRADDWYITYCQAAENLSRQGFNVFVSSHDVVRKQLQNSDEDVVLIYPSPALEKEWIDKLTARYEMSNSTKDYKALMNAKDRYQDNIKELQHSDFEHKLEIDTMDYNLVKIVDNIRAQIIQSKS